MPTTTKPSPIPALEAVEDLTEALAGARVNLATQLQARSREQLTNDLKAIGTYIEPSSRAAKHSLLNKRRMRFLIHEEFARRGIAPAWRGDVSVRFVKAGTPIDPAEQRHRSDSQIIDLMWIYLRDPGHQIKTWVLKEFAALFEGPGFNLRMAEQFARSELTYTTKVDGLNLKPLLQAELMTLRQSLVRREVKSVQERGHEVRNALVRILESNPHRLRGRDSEDVARQLTYGWMSIVLADGAPIVATRIYETMTGEAITRPQLKTMQDTLEGSLTEAGSHNHVKAMERVAGKVPWHRSSEFVPT